jgi:hypothetical protein
LCFTIQPAHKATASTDAASVAAAPDVNNPLLDVDAAG